MRCGSGIFIKENGYARFVPNALCKLFGILNGFFLCNVLHGNKGDNIDRTHAGMFALMMIQVNKLCRFLGKSCCGIHNAFGAAHEGDNAAVVACIAAVIKQCYARSVANGVNTCLDDLMVPALADIRDAFNDLCHFKKTSFRVFAPQKYAERLFFAFVVCCLLFLYFCRVRRAKVVSFRRLRAQAMLI